MEIRKDYRPEEIARALVGLSGISENMTENDEESTVDDCENALYQLMAIAENKYNFDFFRTMWNVLEALTEQHELRLYKKPGLAHGMLN